MTAINLKIFSTFFFNYNQSLWSQSQTSFILILAPVKPVCLPLSGIGTYNDMYAVKFTDGKG